MLPSSLSASLVALVASAIAVSAAPAASINVGLTITLSLPGLKGDGSENTNVVTTVANTGDKSVKLLNDPSGVLDSFPADSFTITGPTGSQPSFNGARVSLTSGYLTNLHHDTFRFHFQVKYSPEYAASLNDPNAYTVLAPGDSVEVTHDRTWDHLDQCRFACHLMV